jgi:hypothetical protein
LSTLLALVRREDLRQVELRDHVEDEVGEVAIREPSCGEGGNRKLCCGENWR